LKHKLFFSNRTFTLVLYLDNERTISDLSIRRIQETPSRMAKCCLYVRWRAYG